MSTTKLAKTLTTAGTCPVCDGPRSIYHQLTCETCWWGKLNGKDRTELGQMVERKQDTSAKLAKICRRIRR